MIDIRWGPMARRLLVGSATLMIWLAFSESVEFPSPAPRAVWVSACFLGAVLMLAECFRSYSRLDPEARTITTRRAIRTSTVPFDAVVGIAVFRQVVELELASGSRGNVTLRSGRHTLPLAARAESRATIIRIADMLDLPVPRNTAMDKAALGENPMSRPALSWIEPIDRTEEANGLTPSVATTTFWIRRHRFDDARNELLAQAEATGYKMKLMTPEANLPLGTYRGRPTVKTPPGTVRIAFEPDTVSVSVKIGV